MEVAYIRFENTDDEARGVHELARLPSQERTTFPLPGSLRHRGPNTGGNNQCDDDSCDGVMCAAPHRYLPKLGPPTDARASSGSAT